MLSLNVWEKRFEILDNFSAIIFDLDGTILDSLYVWHDAGKRFLETLNIRAKENLDRVIFSMSMSQGAQFIKDEYNLPLETKDIIAGVNSIVNDRYKNEVPLKAGARDVLEFFYANKMPFIAATSGDREIEEAALERCGVLNLFKKIFTCSEEGMSKSEPDIFYKCASFMDVPCQKTIVFDDCLSNLKVVKEAGFVAAGFFDRENIGDREAIRKICPYYFTGWK
ncbi:MAG: HAD family phosphatase [Treponema sp.]|nr:HAD family phosphatase [Treponema sp.]